MKNFIDIAWFLPLQAKSILHSESFRETTYSFRVVELGCFRWDKFSRLNICSLLDHCFSTRLRRAARRRTDTWEFFEEKERKEKKVEIEQIVVNVHRNADISEIYSPASPSSRRYFTSVTQLPQARSKPAFSVIGKIQCSVCRWRDLSIPFWGHRF